MGLLEEAFELAKEFVQVAKERNELHKQHVSIQERQLALAEAKSGNTVIAVDQGVPEGDKTVAVTVTETDEGFVVEDVQEVVEDEKAERKRKVQAIKDAGRYEEVKGCGMEKVRRVYDSLSAVADPAEEVEHPSLFPEPATEQVAPSEPAAPVAAEVQPTPAPAATPVATPAADLLGDVPAPVVEKTWTNEEVKQKLIEFQGANGDGELARIINDFGRAATFGQVDPINYSAMMKAMGVEA